MARCLQLRYLGDVQCKFVPPEVRRHGLDLLPVISSGKIESRTSLSSVCSSRPIVRQLFHYCFEELWAVFFVLDVEGL